MSISVERNTELQEAETKCRDLQRQNGDLHEKLVAMNKEIEVI